LEITTETVFLQESSPDWQAINRVTRLSIDARRASFVATATGKRSRKALGFD